VLSVGDAAVVSTPPPGIQEQVQTGGSRQVWPLQPAVSTLLDIYAATNGVLWLWCCSLLQAYEQVRAGQVDRATVLVSKSGFGKQTIECGR
jgi:hypothetical protein